VSTTENPGAVSESNDPLVGTSIAEGRYRIVGIIGEGGMGKVYKGEQKLGDRIRTVAIKTLQPDLAQDNQIVQRFLREAGTVAALEHPNTIKFYESGQLPDGKLFVAMEFIQGESLAHIVARGPLAPQRVEYILGQVCGSLAEAHEQGIVHRDLKPDNVILTQRGAKGDFVKVLDFGIAKRDEAQGEAEAKLTRQGMVLGTPPYMSPEQFTGQPLKPTSDIYSLAMMVYEMLTGKLPYTAATPWEWATKHLTGSPAPFETHPNHAQIPARQKAAVMRALSRDARQRPQSVTEFLNEFTGGASNAGDWNIASSTSQGQGQTSGQGQGMPPTAMVPGVQTPMMGGGFQSGQGAPIPGTMAVPMQTGPGGFQPQQPQQGYQSNQGFQSGQGFGSGYTPAPSNAGFNPVQPPPSNPGFNPMQSQPQGFNPAYGSGQGGYNAPPPANTGSPMKVLAIAAAVVILGGGGLAVALGGRKTNTESNHTSGSQQEAHNGQNTANTQGTVIQNNPQVPQPQQPWPQQPPQPQINNPGIQPIPTPPQPPPNYPQPNTNPDPGVGMQPLPQDPPEQPRPRPIARPRPSCPGSASRIDDLILSGQCRQAQSMFRAMRSAGCAGGAASSFGSACPAP
jgi:serine/threonine protein kinase